MQEHRCRPNSEVIAVALPMAFRPGLFTERDATQVGDEYAGQVELSAGSPEYSVTYRARGYDGIGTAGHGVLEILLLDVNCKLPVSIYKGSGAAEGVHPLIPPVWPFHADKLEDLIQELIILMHPSGGAVSLVGYFLVQPGDIIFVAAEIVSQVFE